MICNYGRGYLSSVCYHSYISSFLINFYFATFDFVFPLESWLKEDVGFVLDLPG